MGVFRAYGATSGSKDWYSAVNDAVNGLLKYRLWDKGVKFAVQQLIW
jgi:hypothetical protein